jgi:succinate dehydrogenase / fumarate reductase cytochrome b subunit
MFQTLGWKSGWWAGLLKKIVVLYCVLYFLGSLVIPGAILTGVLQPAPGTTAAQRLVVGATTTVVQR